MFCCTLSFFLYGAAAISFISYILLFVLDGYIFCEQNLKKKYNSSWAVVTGASSGIGRAITEKLAKQGVNVVMVALDDDLFKSTFSAVKKQFPDVEFRQVGVNLGARGYLEEIQKACVDIQPNLIFNNAGYVRTGMFADSSLDAQMANYECNATAPMIITHFFLNQMLDRKQCGAIFFTSSPAGMFPNPTAALYGATKAFLTEFAASIAPEVKADGIDVLVVNPSPVDTGFYSGNKHNIDAMKFFQRTATSPQVIASCFFRSIGRTVVHDQGYFSICARSILKILDFNFLAALFPFVIHTSADYHKSKRIRGGSSSNNGNTNTASSPKKKK